MANITIGKNLYRGRETPISFGGADRLRHMYMIGKTGVGKSTVFQNMCLQDILNSSGVCFIDPHGESIDWLLSQIPANRLEDVVLFDPSDAEFPMGLNLLSGKDEQEKDFLVSECIQIFYKMFDPQRTGIIGPQFEHWLRNAALTVMAGSEGGSLVEIPKLFVDKQFELHKRKHLKDPIVLEFWTKQMAKTAEFHRSEMLNYFSSKFGHFLNNELMRNILGQRTNSLDFDYIIEHEKILLINLSKGKIGETNAQMLGLVIMSKLQAAIMKRARQSELSRTPFYLYVDEFQNLVTDTFASLLSESRKYGLGMHLTNQYFAQLPDEVRDAILGNVGTMVAFATGVEDADILAREFAPFTKDDFINLERYNFYIKLMVNGKTTEAFSGIGNKPAESKEAGFANEIVMVNELAYGQPKLLVEERIKQALR